VSPELVQAFSAAFARADLPALRDLVTDDVVFESTSPPPDGQRFEGVDQVLEAWSEILRGTIDPVFTEEESFLSGDRAVVRWTYSWTGGDGSPGHVRGVDVMRFRAGKVCEKLSYVKG
jgi:ketosteroid isomerase-like protein